MRVDTIFWVPSACSGGVFHGEACFLGPWMPPAQVNGTRKVHSIYKKQHVYKKKKKKPQQLQTPKCRRAWKAEKVWREGLLLRGYGAGINF